MKWTLFLTLAFIGLVAGRGAWKGDRVYKYKLVVKTFLNGSDKQNGVLTRVVFTIRPQSDNLLIGQVNRADFGEMDSEFSNEQYTNLNGRQSSFRDVPFNKLFKIHLRNGAIHSLSVDDTVTHEQVNALKFIVSQFQVDTKGQNVMKSDDNNLPNGNSNTAFYKTMEPTVNGDCETTYDISPLPEYLAYSDRESVPLPELIREGGAIKIVKNKNYRNCNDRTRYLFNLAGYKEERDQMDLTVSLTTRIVITGSLDDYTIQSSAATNKVGDFSEYIYMTLESMSGGDTNNYNTDKNNYNTGNNNYNADYNDYNTGNNNYNTDNKNYNTDNKNYNTDNNNYNTDNKNYNTDNNNYNTDYYTNYNPRFEKLVNIRSLVYTYDSQRNGRAMEDSENDNRMRSMKSDERKYGVEEKWTGCYVDFPTASTMCQSAFSTEWVNVDRTCCGYFCLSLKAKCRHN